ncbi:MAG: hypothetical protein A3F82_02425 [Deltaproteobacteria bacterium RIFCSPLOWO2_12_FULL_44_12]|nr:MAG: hypothetical protein A2712_02530 [Deltaproteobacteria bacterium RIFCSPHIGHO2_01_FULL_43_49]OGQ29033.1 MAG: hypothetical protein A3D98_04285 [Deltaproteobacteria bacterium RIFCSPHIGHO2_12_FULL_44_21]OGQ32589.1 MAG: hypothetical protein A2979_08430 [Deltaproteobacteria bacterium RIFCSPLOWO2_01_FULL_45_74]OGQ41690.1 MAG: hypothetical protein A3I70_08215 [Deltaproteobacteria bacterium RIFCSPLOWO2_02_FULL_44_34]OGQ71838.1 MAG: hypothetical protein A3F82_02425 [Deltaproteobacteria bacterium R
MKYKKLGNVDVQVSVVGQGCMGLGGYFSKDCSQDQLTINLLQKGIEMGMTFIDTAEVYGEGHAETLVGKACHGIRDRVFIATKFSPEHSKGPAVIKAAERSLKRLGTDYIDLYQIHWPNPAVALEETLEAMGRLVQQGKVRYLGLCNFSLRDLKKALSFMNSSPILSNQVEYNLFDRTIEKQLLPFCQQNGITVVAYSPLDQGKIINGATARAGVQKIADQYGKTTGQIALNWLVSQRNVIVIPKASKLNHLIENATSVHFDLTEEDKNLIADLAVSNPQWINPREVSTIVNASGGYKGYQTVEEAIKNALHLMPSPADLAKDLEEPETLKPVRLKPSIQFKGDSKYDLIEGRNRFWAWIIKHGWDKPVPALIRE